MTMAIRKAIRNTLLALLFAGTVILLAGCGATIKEMDVRNIYIPGNDFNSTLAREYKKLALYENDRMTDWRSARRFGAKAVAAAKGKNPEPERLDDWELTAKGRVKIGSARERLISVLYAGAAVRTPQAAARAQASLDCWAEQLEEGFQPEHIKRCRNNFFTALKKTGMDRTGDTAGKTPTMRALPAALKTSSGAAVTGTETFVIFFPFDGDTVLPTETGAIAIAAQAAGKGSTVRLIIGGHADRSGAKPYNMALSKRRAEAVQKALVRLGIERERMTVQAFGESRPLDATPDGRRRARNRRVEITVGPTPAL